MVEKIVILLAGMLTASLWIMHIIFKIPQGGASWGEFGMLILTILLTIFAILND
jgi:hypothetical protein